jgi:hypothetical protein
LISKRRRYAASESFSGGAIRLMPALFSNTSVRPHRSLTAAAIFVDNNFIGDVTQHFEHVCRRNARGI